MVRRSIAKAGAKGKAKATPKARSQATPKKGVNTDS